KAKAILMGLGISEEQFEAAPEALSGGFQIRLNLAKLLASEPNLLLLDEPTNYLDILSVRWLGKFLRSWKGELIIITHDREFMDSVTTHTMAIHRSRIRRVAGPTAKLYAQILQEEEIHEQTRLNDDKKRKEVERFINRFRASATKASSVQSKIKALEKKERLTKLDEIRTLDFEFRHAPFSGKSMMEIEGLGFGFDASEPLINGLSFTVGRNDRIAVIGKNGKGKTTLLNLLASELAPREGSIRPHPNLRAAYFGQTNIERLNRENTIEKELMEAHPDYNRGAARRVCGAMMFEGDNALKKIEVLSGGEKSRVLLGKLLLSPANMLLLDEPTNHLDMESIDSLIEAIDAFPGSVVIVTHSEMVLNALATRLIIFDRGRTELFEGTYGEFLLREGWESEAAERAGAGASAGAAPRGVNRKESRRMRAAILSEKTRMLSPMQKRMSGMEEEISALEQKAEDASTALLKASGKGAPSEITEHSKALHAARARIDELFDELESLNDDYQKKISEFETRLDEVD
ncbi:MAG: ABC-F family ATP-binding cassette domain-containing protein, partial [Deltaproteobacteria bacterium]|nr:ABC-F family ATP-binding cassette domain-containing protein [Deltaproteobacteria bacterium]